MNTPQRREAIRDARQGCPRWGLMGGTFDPVHLAHLQVAEEARERLGLDRVIWLPAGDPPHKQRRPITAQEHRYAMTLLATAEHPGFVVSRLELERQGASYAIDTVHHFLREQPEVQLYFIMGSDSAVELLTWHRHEELIQACRIGAVSRPGFSLDELQGALPPAHLQRIDPLPAPALAISSSDIRRRVREGRSIRYLVPEPVAIYIRKHRLYQAAGGEEETPQPD
jgi:nicotinate-nucleotide adenylyltransferase